ncbi:MAG TPA: VOC family protein [Anaerolineales bacterium]|nr:VOC family protein [Anaerolineales bacterium]
MKLTHIRLLVNDIEACRSFYKDKLGFKEQLAVVEGIYYEFVAGDCMLALYKRDLMESVAGVAMVGEKGADKVALTFEVPDVDAAYKALRAKGIEFVTEPHDQETWVLRVAHLRDPEGNLIEINAPLKK